MNCSREETICGNMVYSNLAVIFWCSGLVLATVSCEAVSYVGKLNEASKVMDAKKEHYYIV